MEPMYWNDLYANWGWFLWIGIGFLLISSYGNWRYSHLAHQKYDNQPLRSPMQILNERYAKGDIERQEYLKMKEEIYYSNS